MSAVLAFVVVLVFAAGHRLRGSVLAEEWFGFGLGLARLCCWAVPGALLCWGVLGYAWFEAVGICAGLYAGSLAGQPGHLNMGRRGDGAIDWEEWRADVAAAALRGLHWTAYPALALVYTRPSAVIVITLSGLATPLAYELGWRTAAQMDAQRELNEGAEWGEVWLGVFIGLAFVIGSLV